MASTGIDLNTAVWRKSSYSNGTGGECVEVADAHPGTVIPVRDSKKAQDGPVLLFRPLAWSVFLDSLKG
ncbi:DUF397 domain-containing protein [Streptomyces sp. NBC_00557]|uniref:DUF397 domain-containing protein n=1 Tax=Streptomyces sp. NBC_00557 TaxID=2975776 RepID=UPI002E80F7BA|nr:DUF397 domain-containing protein [Streptomyces sp. NBC_00557]WUC36291.1 DUF397 domain-containing protein [Streptomyces sp. NBC_00557]